MTAIIYAKSPQPEATDAAAPRLKEVHFHRSHSLHFNSYCLRFLRARTTKPLKLEMTRNCQKLHLVCCKRSRRIYIDFKPCNVVQKLHPVCCKSSRRLYIDFQPCNVNHRSRKELQEGDHFMHFAFIADADPN